MAVTAPKTRDEWLRALDGLPPSPEKIPAFFFAHSSPIMEMNVPGMPMSKGGPLSQFLKDFGKTLVDKYKPKAIVVFSAHWDTEGMRLGMRWSCVARVRDVRLYLRVIVVTDYGDENPLHFDYYGFPPEFFQFKFKSRGDSHLANRIVGLYKKVGD